MVAPNLTILWNSSQNDVPNTGGAAGDGNWKIFDSVNDQIGFLGEGTDDQDPISGKDIFIIPESGNREVPKIFVKDFSESKWDRIWLAGSNVDQGGGGNNRYCMGVFLDGTSAQAPQLRCWDSTSHDTYNLGVLGSGIPANSMIRSVSTTDGTPGDQWAGTPLAGSGSSNVITLSSGAIGSPQMIYWNMRMLVPHSANPFAANPVMNIYLTYS